MSPLCYLFVVSASVLLTLGDAEMFGAPRKLQPNEATIEKFNRELVKVAHKFNSEHGNNSLHIITKLVNVTSQGILYTFYVKFSPTSCTTFAYDNTHVLGDIFLNQNSCDVTGGESKICKVTVWQRPWLRSDASEIIKIVNCSTDKI
ncbi:uncharacterized protein DC041_0000527 [Schistosoma bovis]|uniref:Cystatin domain-containing protein n=1 Tax=Schistosoma bovis TaxID=6184 RepID=A0A430PX48_SCHBO|nr:uncharacterized protein DC041_0000527 [Schistosoma bovis]